MINNNKIIKFEEKGCEKRDAGHDNHTLTDRSRPLARFVHQCLITGNLVIKNAHVEDSLQHLFEKKEGVNNFKNKKDNSLCYLLLILYQYEARKLDMLPLTFSATNCLWSSMCFFKC